MKNGNGKLTKPNPNVKILIEKATEFLKKKYEFRHNFLLENYEYREKEGQWKEITEKTFNDIHSSLLSERIMIRRRRAMEIFQNENMYYQYNPNEKKYFYANATN